jgi:hypothetical protein
VVNENRLPSGFTEIEYVESDGSQYINTGIGFSDNSSFDFELKCMWPELTTTSGVGHHRAAISSVEGLIKVGNTQTSESALEWHTAKISWATGNCSDTLTQLNYLDGRLVGSCSTQPYDNKSYLLFAMPSWDNKTGIPPYSYEKMRIGYCKIYNNDVLVRDLIPCIRQLDGYIGFYDLITDKFFTYDDDFNCGNYIEDDTLPDTYTAVEYIESTGSQYIDTEYKISSENMKVEFKCEISDATNGLSLFGSRGSGYDLVPYTSISYGSGVFKHWVGGDLGVMSVAYSTTSANTVVYTLENNVLSCDINGTLSSVAFSGSIKSGSNFFIFGLNDAGSSSDRAGGYKLYYLKLYDNGRIVRDLIPVKRTDGTVGMYDKITQTFYGNAKAVSFYGGDLWGHDFDDGKMLNEVSYCQDGEYVYTCKICGKQIYKHQDKYSYQVDFDVDDGVDFIKIFKDYDPSKYEISDIAYTRNKNTFNYSKVDGIVICEIVLKDGLVIDDITAKNGMIVVTKQDNRYIISGIDRDIKISITTKERVVLNIADPTMRKQQNFKR